MQQWDRYRVPQNVFLLNDTSLGDRQKDATNDSIVVGNDDSDQQRKRHLQFAADDRCELPSDACQSLISGDAETNEYNRAALPPARPKTDKRERRYSFDRQNVDSQSRAVAQSTWLTMSQPEYSDACEKRFIQDTKDTSLPPGFEQRATVIPSVTGDYLTAFCSDPSVRSTSGSTGGKTTVVYEFCIIAIVTSVFNGNRKCAPAERRLVHHV